MWISPTLDQEIGGAREVRRQNAREHHPPSLSHDDCSLRCGGGVQYFRLYDLRSTYATRLSAGGVADEWVTQLLRQGDSQVFKKYSQMKLQMKREALQKMNRQANEVGRGFDTALTM